MTIADRSWMYVYDGLLGSLSEESFCSIDAVCASLDVPIEGRRTFGKGAPWSSTEPVSRRLSRNCGGLTSLLGTMVREPRQFAKGVRLEEGWWVQVSRAGQSRLARFHVNSGHGATKGEHLDLDSHNLSGCCPCDSSVNLGVGVPRNIPSSTARVGQSYGAPIEPRRPHSQAHITVIARICTSMIRLVHHVASSLSAPLEIAATLDSQAPSPERGSGASQVGESHTFRQYLV